MPTADAKRRALSSSPHAIFSICVHQRVCTRGLCAHTRGPTRLAACGHPFPLFVPVPSGSPNATGGQAGEWAARESWDRLQATTERAKAYRSIVVVHGSAVVHGHGGDGHGNGGDLACGPVARQVSHCSGGSCSRARARHQGAGGGKGGEACSGAERV